jgi:uncharacterized protein YciI
MLFIVKLIDKPNSLGIRQQYLEDHKAWLAAHASQVIVSGALRHDPDGQPFGGLWIVEADGKSAVEQLLETDPFWKQGLRASREIWHWSRPDLKLR